MASPDRWGPYTWYLIVQNELKQLDEKNIANFQKLQSEIIGLLTCNPKSEPEKQEKHEENGRPRDN
jgi:hypothetical protein